MRESEKQAHRKYNRERMKSISFRLHKESDADLIAKYEAIDDKMAFFRWALRNYEKEDVNAK
jgi:hypothetical protein